MAEPPLEQRTLGRRAQRRQRQEEEEALVKTEKQRGPTDEVERRIQHAIDRRKEERNQFDSSHAEEYKEPIIVGNNYEYLDHTADIQIHSWGSSLEEALEQAVVAMFGYKTRLDKVRINEAESKMHASKIEAQGHDLPSLVFMFLQEWLYVFHESQFIVKEVKIDSLDANALTMRSSGKGEIADWSRHVQGTEIKAVTYSNLQVHSDDDGVHHIFVIVDI